MLCENITAFRKKNGLSQEELAARLHVVRQTVSKWEKGKSVPDAEMLQSLAAALDCQVSDLLGESISAPENQLSLEEMALKLEEINKTIARQTENRRKKWHIFFWIICAVAVLILAGLLIHHVYLQVAEKELASTIGIIGGADGPTAIFVTGPEIDVQMLIFTLIGLAIAITGIIRTRRK